jgi:type VI secretion system protein ImpH
MDPEERNPAAPVSDEAARLEAARRRGFRALLLVVDRLRSGAASELAGATAPHEERIRFRHDPSLAFSTSDVPRVREVTVPAEPGHGEARTVLEITTTFLGLTGAVSPLPPYLAEEIAQESADENEDAPARRRDFLDLFHHRALSFFHRAGAKHDPAASHRSDRTDEWSLRLLALLGMDRYAGAAEDPRGEPAWRLLRLAPLLAERAVTAAGLEAALADVLGDDLPAGAGVRVEQFAGIWVDLAPGDRTRLGSAATELGRSVILGRRVFDRSGKFRVVVGPLAREGYERFAAGPPVEKIRRLARALVGDGQDHEVVVRLAPDAAPPLALSAHGPVRLGRSAWLGRQSREARLRLEPGAGG